MAATPAATSVEAVTSPHRDDTASVPIWTPSTTIIDLPNEILRDIFLAIDGEFSKSLYSLSLTCKHFRAIVEEHCKPEYNLRGKELDHALELLEQLIDRPSFKRSIRVLNLQYQHAFLPTETSAETLTLANRLGLAALQKELWEFDWDDDPSNMAAALLAASVPNLETCHVSMPQEGTGAFDHLVQYLTMVDRPFESLRNLILTNTANTAVSFQEDVFHTICALPSLVRLQIRGLSFDGWSHARPSSERLEYLDMDESQRNFNRYYQKKLEPLKALEHLRLRLTDCQLSMENEDRPRYVENPYFLEHSLETLELFSNERYYMSLVGIGIAGPEHLHMDTIEVLEHLKWMFPPSLEILTHLVWDGPIINNDDYTLPLLRSRWSVIWLHATPDMFPKLKVVMVQKYGLNGLDEERKVIWKRED